MNRLEKARILRKQIDASLSATRKLIRVDELSPEELEGMVDLYKHYEIGRHYAKDDVFQYEGKLYKVLKGIVSKEQYKPNETPSEYLPIQPDGVIPEWVQPTGEHDAYESGDKVIFENKVWVCTQVDAGGKNSWVPGAYGWEIVE